MISFNFLGEIFNTSISSSASPSGFFSSFVRSLARNLTKLKKKPEGDADEDIEVLKIAPIKLNELIASGEESLDGKTITAWFRACQLLNIG